MLVQHGFQRRSPPRRISQVLQSTLRQGCHLAAISSKFGQHSQISIKLAHEVLFRTPLVAVNTHQFYAVITRIALQILLFSQVSSHTRRVGPEQIVKSVLRQLVLQHVPQLFVLIGRAELLAPPEPRACVLVPGTEDDGYLLSVCSRQGSQEVGHTLHPRLELLILATTRQDVLHHRCVSHIPSCSLRELLSGIATTLNRCQRVTRMPADGYDTTTVIMVDDFFSHTREGHAVKILGIAHLNTTQLEAHHGRIVTTHVLHVAGVLVVIPGETIERIVLMTKHIAFLTKAVQPFLQLLRPSLFRLNCLRRRAGRH